MHLFHRGKIYPIFIKYFFSPSISLALIIKLFYFFALIYTGKIIAICQKSSYDDYAILLAEIGGGKGKVTRHFIVRGIQQLLNHLRVSRIISKKELSQEEQIALSNSCEVLI